MHSLHPTPQKCLFPRNFTAFYTKALKYLKEQKYTSLQQSPLFLYLIENYCLRKWENETH